MKANLLEQLRVGKSIRVKHPEYGFSIHAKLKLEDGHPEPTVTLEKINTPQKAGKAEKLLLKLVHIYCFDVLCNNLLNDVVASKEYQKIIQGMKNDNAAIAAKHNVGAARR